MDTGGPHFVNHRTHCCPDLFLPLANYPDEVPGLEKLTAELLFESPRHGENELLTILEGAAKPVLKGFHHWLGIKLDGKIGNTVRPSCAALDGVQEISGGRYVLDGHPRRRESFDVESFGIYLGDIKTLHPDKSHGGNSPGADIKRVHAGAGFYVEYHFPRYRRCEEESG